MAFDVEGARKAGYSDTEIADHLATEKKFDAKGARDTGYSDADIISHLGAPSGLDTVKDVAKQVGAAIPSLIETAVTWPAKLANLAAPVGNYLGRKVEGSGLGTPDEQAVQNREKLNQLIAQQGGSKGIKQYLPEPETQAGQYARTGTEFAGSTLLGMPGKAAQTAINAGIGLGAGLASEGAGQLAEAYQPELAPAARILAPILTGGLLSAAPNALARKTASNLRPTVEKNLADGDAKFEAVKTMGVTFDPTAVSKGLGDVKTSLRNQFGDNTIINPVMDQLESRLAAHAPLPQRPALDPRPNPPPKPPVDISDLQNLRSQLGKQATALDPTLRHAAQVAKEEVDDLIGTLAKNPAHVISGDAKAADALLQEAREAWGAGRRGQTVAGRIELGDNNQMTAGAGGNINAGRKAIKSLMNPDMNGRSQATKRGYNEPEQAQMKSIMRGDWWENKLRTISGAGWLPGAIGGSGVMGYYASGDPRYLAAIPVAAGAKLLSGSLTKKKERILQEMVDSRSPLGRAYQITAPPQRLSTGATGTLLGLQAARQQLLDDEDQSRK